MGNFRSAAEQLERGSFSICLALYEKISIKQPQFGSHNPPHLVHDLLDNGHGDALEVTVTLAEVDEDTVLLTLLKAKH